MRYSRKIIAVLLLAAVALLPAAGLGEETVNAFDTLRVLMEMEFDEDGDAYMVDCNFEAVPSCVVPGNIAHYIRANFPGAVIVKIERDRRGYDVDLSNGLEVHFNYDGRVIDVDD